MLYEDRMAVATPEGVTLEFTLAGVGSRFTAAMLDGLVRTLVILGAWLVSAVASLAIEDWAYVFLILVIFFILFGYDIVFETWASGRTPGKRWTGLRVVRVGGAPVTFMPSAVRNLLRLVDILPTAYLIGIIAVMSSSKNQRLGDMAAGTIVVRERTVDPAVPRRSEQSWSGWLAETSPERGEPSQFATWDVSTVTAEEVATIRQFLARRSSLDPPARRRLALDLANRLRPKVVMPEERMGPEGFLEKVLAAKAERE